MIAYKFITLNRVASEKLGCGRGYVYTLIKHDESFPTPIKRGRSTVFVESEIDAYMAHIAVTRRGLLADQVPPDAPKRGRKPKLTQAV
jgi:predicted DNA-binding transcriptional regulator AlpA